jgi:Mn-dependent DtxR family transcriptional regulator
MMITISEQVLNDKKIPPSAKLLLGYVQMKKEISDTNDTLSKLFAVTPVSITSWVARLEKAGYVDLKYEKRKRTITAKELTPVAEDVVTA